MATASEAHPTDRALSDREFEELLQRTWELVQIQKQRKIVRPFESAPESPSWT
jgi:Lhr-like helicase